MALRIDLPTANSIELAPGADVDVYLDNSPLGGLAARLRSVSYTPRVQPGGTTSYTVMADPQDGAAPRIGARGHRTTLRRARAADRPAAASSVVATRQFIGL